MATIMALARRTAHAIVAQAERHAAGGATSRDERFARVGELELCYEELGDPDGEPMLLVMGLGTQLIHWHPGFCDDARSSAASG